MSSSFDKDFQRSLHVPQDKSAFRGMLFTIMLEVFEQQGIPFAFDYSDKDFFDFLYRGTEGMQALKSIGTVIGLKNDGAAAAIRCDPVTTQSMKVTYFVGCNPSFTTYFLNEEITGLLEKTKLEWMDLQIFEELPDLFAMKIPKGHLTMRTLGGAFTLEDILVARVKTPMAKRLMLKQHDLADDPHLSLFYWMAASRDEFDQGIQNVTFGTFFINSDVKLENMLECIDEWGEHQAKYLLENIKPGILESLKEEGAQRDMLDVLLGRGDGERHKRTAEYIEGVLDVNALRSDMAGNRKTLELVFKFIMLRGSEQFNSIRVEKLPPGVKPGKTSSKAQTIQKGLWKAWGKRVFVGAPVVRVEKGSHASPIRHLVPGFFRRQAYGPKNSLRKVIWISPFYRGTNIVRGA